MHISRLRITGVRGFYDNRTVDLDLTRPDGTFAGWTVLAGRNGSGKSTVLQSLALALSGPRSTGFIPSLADWMSHGATRAEVRVTLSLTALGRMDTQFPVPENGTVPPRCGWNSSGPSRPRTTNRLSQNSPARAWTRLPARTT